jgi:hypothetical protein
LAICALPAATPFALAYHQPIANLAAAFCHDHPFMLPTIRLLTGIASF